MSMRKAAAALAVCLATLGAAAPGRAAEAQASRAGYNFDAEHVHGGVRWGYARLYRAPVMSSAFDGCRWMSVPTAYGQRFRPACDAG